jgi:hypothetical protein
VKDVLPAGHREGREWRAGNVQGDQGSSLAVRLSGPKAGLWNDFASGESGDALSRCAPRSTSTCLRPWMVSPLARPQGWWRRAAEQTGGASA